MSSTPWTYLQENQPSDFLWNMAFDEWMLREWPDAIVRLYRWDKPTYSVGYFQSVQMTAETYRCADNGYQVVRRITGGGSVPHGDEWTLSVAMRADSQLLPQTAAESYIRLHQLLVKALCAAGHQANLMKAPCSMNARGRRACFEEPVNHDIEVGGKKVIGTSQRRMTGRVLFQSSIQLPYSETLPEELSGIFEEWFGRPADDFKMSDSIKTSICKLIDQKYTNPDYSYPQPAEKK